MCKHFTSFFYNIALFLVIAFIKMWFYSVKLLKESVHFGDSEMFGDDLPIKKKISEFPKILDDLSVVDLKEYILDLEAEICRVKSDIDKKQASQKAAELFFKS